ncbi:MAG: hypothetical protein Q9166_006315 [cf. Caloplaca sp. 2 TL-2023]
MATRSSVLSSEASTRLTELGEDVTASDGWLHLRAKSLSSSSESDAFVNIPQDLESRETLSFLGFTEYASSIIYDRFLNSPDLYDAELIDFAKAHIRSTDDAATPEDNWVEAMLRMGIKTSLCEAIMDPTFADLRVTQTASFWVLDVITTKYMFLQDITSMVLAPQKATGNVSLESRFSANAPPAGPSSPSKMSKLLPWKKAGKPILLESEILLVKGGNLPRLTKAIRLDTDPAGVTINRLQNAISGIPGDFSGTEPGLYFSTQREVALHYVGFLSRILGDAGMTPIGVGILHMIAPKDLLADFNQVFGTTWQEFVMVCRLQQPIPQHLQFLTESPVLIGPILSCNDRTVARLVGPTFNFAILQQLRTPSGAMFSQHFIKGADIINALNTQPRL